MRLVHELRTHLQYKIIFPFLALTLLVSLTGAAVAILYFVGTVQDRLNNQLAQVTRTTSDMVVSQETANLNFLREIVLAGSNALNGAPPVAEAFAKDDLADLQLALDPYFEVGYTRPGVRLTRLIAFDTEGQTTVDWAWEQRSDNQPVERVSYPSRDITSLWFTSRILERQQDELGDKFAGLLSLDGKQYLFTVAPVLQDDKVVGGLLIASDAQSFLEELQGNTLAAVIALYNAENGTAFASTQLATDSLDILNIPTDQLAKINDPQFLMQQSIFNTVTINQRGYQFAYVPLRIRGSTIGILSTALANDYVSQAWLAARSPLILSTIIVSLAIVGLGILVARRITRPIQKLVATSQAVMNGDLEARSDLQEQDEIGILSNSFNNMTAHLLDLYREVRTESSQRAAIVESITDGVIVCDPDGAILLMNQAARRLLNLSDDEPPPTHYNQIQLEPQPESAMVFGAQATRFYALGEHFVRVDSATVTDEGVRLGDVYVFQDMTSEVAIDRAKTGFIATISHELRTPLTVINGSSDLLARGLAGDLSDDQQMLVESIRKHTQMMTGLLNNVITIAGLDSGTLSITLEEVDLHRVLEDLLWQFRKTIAAKQIELIVDVPQDLPLLYADTQQLRNALFQLIDNACRYTEKGYVALKAFQVDEQVQIQVNDSGPGISPDLEERLFTRFTRGSEGINSAERGIGLGLAIAKELIERQGGSIQLTQTSDEGSTFTLTLPILHADQHEHPASLVSSV